MLKIRFYEGHQVTEYTPTDLPHLLQRTDGTLWVDITTPDDTDSQTLETLFKFHPLTIEDLRNQQQRPKAEEFTDYLFIILNPIDPKSQDPDTLFRELDVFIGKNYIVTAHPEYEPVIDTVLERLRRTDLALSATYLLYLLMDSVVDNYFPVLDSIDEQLDRLSNTVLSKPSKDTLNKLFDIKSMVSEMWRVMWPQRDILNILMNHNLVYINQNTLYYLRDIHDHLIKLTDLVQALRDNLNSLINLYVSAVSNQLNLTVNRLTILTVIFGVFSVIGGFYGMNFEKTWPPFGADWGVIFVLGLMALCVVSILAFVNRNRLE